METNPENLERMEFGDLLEDLIEKMIQITLKRDVKLMKYLENNSINDEVLLNEINAEYASDIKPYKDELNNIGKKIKIKGYWDQQVKRHIMDKTIHTHRDFS